MPKRRVRRTKLARQPTAKDVARTTRVDPKLAAAWKKIFARISHAESRGAEAFDELWEAAAAAAHHDPPLYVFGGFKSASDFFLRALHTDLRSATRNMAVAAHATPKEEELYGTSSIAAALDYLTAKFGTLGATLPVAFERLKIPVREGTHTKLVPFPKASVAEIIAATRLLQRKAAGEPVTDRAEAAIARSMARHPAFKKVRFSVRAGFLHVRAIPLASLDLFAKALADVSLPEPAKNKQRR